jgi:GntR family transcriptional repressor for pyruvate dehydrogenase complex
MSNGFKTVQVSRNRLSEQIAVQLKQLMVHKELSPGERLPSERLLAEQFGVSRSIVREAAKLLEQQGLVSIEVGRGTFITAMQPESITDSLQMLLLQHDDGLSFDHVYAVRQMIELETARIAALNASADDIDELERFLHEMIKYRENIEEFSFADTEFHKALARATHNPLFLTLLMPITHLLRQIQRTASRTKGGPSDAIHFHELIVKALRNHDSDASVAAMRDHLASVLKWLKAAQGTDHDD